jgi:hypothetical protein
VAWPTAKAARLAQAGATRHVRARHDRCALDGHSGKTAACSSAVEPRPGPASSTYKEQGVFWAGSRWRKLTGDGCRKCGDREGGGCSGDSRQCLLRWPKEVAHARETMGVVRARGGGAK